MNVITTLPVAIFRSLEKTEYTHIDMDAGERLVIYVLTKCAEHIGFAVCFEDAENEAYDVWFYDKAQIVHAVECFKGLAEMCEVAA